MTDAVEVDQASATGVYGGELHGAGRVSARGLLLVDCVAHLYACSLGRLAINPISPSACRIVRI